MDRTSTTQGRTGTVNPASICRFINGDTYLVILKVLFAVVLLLQAIPASAKVDVLGGGWSVHHDGGDYNEQHGVVGLCLEHWCAASYTNSYSKRSVLGYYYHPFLQGGWWSLDAKLGVMGGYEGHVDDDYHVNGYMPMVGVGFSIRAFSLNETELWLDTTVTPMVTMFNLRVSL